MANLFISDDEKKLLIYDMKEELIAWDKRRFAWITTAVLVLGIFGFTTLINSQIRSATDEPISNANTAAERATNTLTKTNEALTALRSKIVEIDEDLAEIKALSLSFSGDLTQKLNELEGRSSLLDSQFDQTARKLAEVDVQITNIQLISVQGSEPVQITSRIAKIASDAGPDPDPVDNSCASQTLEDLIHHPRPRDIGCGQAAQQADYQRIANNFSVDDLALQAFFDVINARLAAPFDNIGRPTIDFDANEFHDSLPQARRAAAIANGVGEKNWGDLPLPANNDEQFARLRKAYEFDRDAAIKATYWGIDYTKMADADIYGQTDGQQMIVSTFVSEANQIELSMLWAEQDEGLTELQNRDWAGLAGTMFDSSDLVSEYAKLFGDTYDQLLIKRLGVDTSGDVLPTDLARLQRTLNSLGVFLGPADGIFGAATFDAIKAFQTTTGLPTTGKPDAPTLARAAELTPVSK